jgi:tetraacyldisaccharide 4'-kinase
MSGRLTQAWLGRGALARLLWPLSQLYRAAEASRRALYRLGWLRVERLPVPVIVVGNVVAGGAGKTPLVMAVVAHLQARGWQPGVISRGHGRRGSVCLEVLPGLDAAQCGDEPLLMARRTAAPVFVAAQRVQAARALLSAHPQVDILVADDGLQHHALGRDLNIAVFDERGTGNGWLLPAGALREPWPRRGPLDAHDPIAPIDLVVHTSERAPEGALLCRRRLADYAEAADGSRQPLAQLRGQPLQAWAGIAKPEQFFGMLRQAGLSLAQTRSWPDHHAYTAGDLQALSGQTILVTEKDAVKLMPLAATLATTIEPANGSPGPKLLAVPLLVEPEVAFFEALDARLGRLHGLPSHHGHTTS